MIREMSDCGSCKEKHAYAEKKILAAGGSCGTEEERIAIWNAAIETVLSELQYPGVIQDDLKSAIQGRIEEFLVPEYYDAGKEPKWEDFDDPEDYEKAHEKWDELSHMSEQEVEEKREQDAEWAYLNSEEYMKELYGEDLENYPDD